MRVALESGALAEFGHKYGDVVTVYTITDSSGGIVSREICGGPTRPEDERDPPRVRDRQGSVRRSRRPQGQRRAEGVVAVERLGLALTDEVFQLGAHLGSPKSSPAARLLLLR